MNADFLFETGDSHKVCEDYGRVNTDEANHPFIVQSDGCSDPLSPDTDFGARLLVKSAENFIVAGLPNYGDQAVAAAQAQARAIGLHPNCLDATLIVAMALPDHRKTEVKMWGDEWSGKRRNGTIVAYVALSPKSADGNGSIPFYISYTLDRNRMVNYKAAGTPKMAVYEFSADGKVVSRVETDAPPAPATLDFGHDEFEFVSTFSDGVESFYYRDAKGTQISVPVEQVVFPMTNFVGYAGEFVRRQYNIFNRTLAVPNKWKHYDDLSYGAIYHGELP